MLFRSALNFLFISHKRRIIHLCVFKIGCYLCRSDTNKCLSNSGVFNLTQDKCNFISEFVVYSLSSVFCHFISSPPRLRHIYYYLIILFAILFLHKIRYRRIRVAHLDTDKPRIAVVRNKSDNRSAILYRSPEHNAIPLCNFIKKF